MSTLKGTKQAGYWVCGIDEAGRGPLAGPVVVAAVSVSIKNKKIAKNAHHLLRHFRFKGLRDSKRLTEKARIMWYARLINEPKISYRAVTVSPRIIDRFNIAQAAHYGVRKVLALLPFRPDYVLLDGSLRAPRIYKQQVIPRGDRKIPLIAAASVIAKVTRDRIMLRLHKKYPQYGFNKHKGYGTKLHQKLLRRHGVSPIHRRTFITNYLVSLSSKSQSLNPK